MNAQIAIIRHYKIGNTPSWLQLLLILFHFFAMLGTEPRASCMLGKCSMAELCPGQALTYLEITAHR